MTFRLLLCCIAALSFNANAQSDDGFIWIDANTRIKIKPVGAAAGATKAPEAPKKDKKPEKEEKPKK